MRLPLTLSLFAIGCATEMPLEHADPSRQMTAPFPCVSILTGNLNLVADATCPVGAGGAAIIVTGNGATVDCRGFTLDAGSNGAGAAIEVRADDVTIENCRFDGYDEGIRVVDGRGARLMGNTFERYDVGIHLVPGAEQSVIDARAIRNDFEPTFGVGIRALGDVQAARMSVNDIDNVVAGIEILATPDHRPTDTLVALNNIWSTSRGVVVTEAERTRIVRNTVLDTHETGILDTRARCTEIDDNTFQGGSGTSIDASDAQSCPAGRGFTVRTRITDNTTTGDDIGISVGPFGAYDVLRNTVVDADVGIATELAWSPRVNGNDVTVPAGGVGLSLNSSDDPEVIQNTVSGGTIGIRLTDSGAVDVQRNTVDSATADGILVLGATAADLLENTVTAPAGSDGIEIGAPPSGTLPVLLLENATTGGTNGIHLTSVDISATVQNNEIRDASAGLRSDSSTLVVTMNTFDGNIRHVDGLPGTVVGIENCWEEIGSLQIFDSNADGRGDTGPDWPFAIPSFIDPSPWMNPQHCHP